MGLNRRWCRPIQTFISVLERRHVVFTKNGVQLRTEEGGRLICEWK